MKGGGAPKLPPLTPRTLARLPKGASPGAKGPKQSRSGASSAPRPRGIRALVAEIVKLRAAVKRG